MAAGERESIGIQAHACATALGDAAETCARLLEGAIALRLTPVLGRDGGDAVPLALIGAAHDESIPPRWEAPLDALVARIPERPWGSARYPVFLSSSNFDVGSLYAYRQSGDERYLRMGTPGRTLERIRQRYGWGPNAVALSHACVTAQVAIEMASRRLSGGFAEEALVLSFDFVSPFVAGGFHALKILNDRFPAPFQDGAIGSVALGDGAAFVVLSRAAAAVRIESNFLHNEMFHFTSNDPSGAGFAAAARWAREAAAGRPLWLKGHGTGTLDSGRLEAEAFQRELPEAPLVSWKGSLGHTLGSCGLVELAVALEAIRCGRAPGTLGAAAPTFAPNAQLEAFDLSRFGAVALFSNAFGGAHAGCLLTYD